MIAGLGVDICTLEQVEDLVTSFGGELDAAVEPLSGVFTAAELARAQSRANPIEHLAGLFAAKEAVFKALSATWDEGARMSDIEIWPAESGQPQVTLRGSFAELLGPTGSILVTISHDGGVALAAAVIDR